MKRLFLLLLIGSLATAIFSQTKFTVDGIDYSTTGINTVEIVSGTFTGDVTIPSTVSYSSKTYEVKSISNYAFSGRSRMTSIVLPSSITRIGMYAFENCTGLKSINLLASIRSVELGTFSNCSGLSSITIPSTVDTIRSDAFEKCTYLISVTLPISLKSIGSKAFANCTLLTSITIPPLVSCIEYGTFSKCTNLRSITFPSTLTSIENSAFSYCSGFTAITLPSSLLNIGNSAFANCSKLSTISIPSGVTTIGSMAFYYCEALKSVVIPASVTTIGSYAFDKCSVMSEIRTYILAPKHLNNGQFDFINNITCKLYVPTGTSKLYKAVAGWQDFLNIIEFDPTAIEEHKIQPLIISPNYSSSIITIHIDDNERYQTLRIVDLSGKTLYHSNLTQNQIQLDISHFPNGIYLLQLESDQGIIRKSGKFLKL